MLDATSEDALVKATQNKLQISINYTKTNGEVVDHTGGVYEIGVNKTGRPCIWLWDTTRNDTIRQFLQANINSLVVTDIPFFPPQAWPIKINGEIMGY